MPLDLNPEHFSTFIDEAEGFCVRNDDPMHARHLWVGRTLIRGDHPTRLAGWLDIVERGAFIEDYDDRMWPISLSSPTKLFRAVSLYELSDIATRGAIWGGGNQWNGFDPRPLVFFSPEMTDACIYQGAELERLASVLAYQLYDEQFKGRAVDRSEDYRPIFVEEYQRLKDTIPSLEYTSAVLETGGIFRGFHYSREHGSTGMNGADEYGFIPGHIKLADIVAVHWVKNLQVVATTEMAAVGEIFQRIGFSPERGARAFELPPRAPL